MNKKIVLYLASTIVMVTAAAMLASAVVAWIMGDSTRDILRLAESGLLTAVVAGIGMTGFRPCGEKDRKFGLREGYAIVALAWLCASLFGMLPFLLVTGLKPWDAFFETASGFSTTGASVIDSSLVLMSGKTLPHGIESLSYGILFWRSLMHWLGGMGIVVLTIAILPLLNIGGQALFNAEATGVKSASPENRIAPRIAESAKLLWMVYFLLTAAETLLLRLGGMDMFDAICHSFSTIATGGFSTKQTSIAYFHSSYIDWVIAAFMFLSGCNFILHFRCLTGRPREYWRDEEFRFYSLLVLVSTIVITLYLMLTPGIHDSVSQTNYYHALFPSLRDALFQVVSTLTSTGFATADYCSWPTITGVILFCLMFIGGCGGSTSGGMKCVRALLMGKQSLSEIRRCIFPRLVPAIRLNGNRLEMTSIQKTVGFFSLFCCFYLLFVPLVSLACPAMSVETAMTVSVACLSNIGPGFGQVGPAFSYAWMTPAAKILLAFEMILGRLELYTLLVLFLPSFWKK